MAPSEYAIPGKGSGLDAPHSRSALNRCVPRQWLLALVLAALVTGCAITKDYQAPQVETPPAWRVEYQAAADAANTAWWETFQDPVLTRLIETAINENKDLLIAAARVDEAEARTKAAQSAFWPQIGYGAGAGYRQETENLVIPYGTTLDRDFPVYQGLLSASWELDVWGRIRRSTEAARADYLSTEEARQAVILTLVASVANGYLELLRLDKQLIIAKNTVAFRKEYLQLFEKKKKGGQISELELAQVKSHYEQAVTRIPVLEMQIAMGENALSVLLGRNPGPIERGKTLDTIGAPAIPAGIPSEVLIRRPDIRRSENILIGANARIGVARTLYFPSVSLTGVLGLASTDISDLLDSSSIFYNAGAGLLGPIFTGGRITSEVKQAEAMYTQMLNNYLRTIQVAFKEVNDSLVSRQKNSELLQEQRRLVSALKDYSTYSRKSFDAGFSGYVTVLDAEDKLFIAELRYAQVQSDLLRALSDIYKAMGGGWVTEADKLMVPPAQQAEKAAAKK